MVELLLLTRGWWVLEDIQDCIESLNAQSKTLRCFKFSEGVEQLQFFVSIYRIVKRSPSAQRTEESTNLI